MISEHILDEVWRKKILEVDKLVRRQWYSALRRMILTCRDETKQKDPQYIKIYSLKWSKTSEFDLSRSQRDML